MVRGQIPVSRALVARRTRALDVLLIAGGLVGLPAVVRSTLGAVRRPPQWPRAAAAIAVYLLVLCLLAVFRRNHTLRSGCALALWYSAGLLSTVRQGPAGDGRVILLAVPQRGDILAQRGRCRGHDPVRQSGRGAGGER
jgi:hypothetical protein